MAYLCDLTSCAEHGAAAAVAAADGDEVGYGLPLPCLKMNSSFGPDGSLTVNNHSLSERPLRVSHNHHAFPR
jgi:hypothetical protein